SSRMPPLKATDVPTQKKTRQKNPHRPNLIRKMVRLQHVTEKKKKSTRRRYWLQIFLFQKISDLKNEGNRQKRPVEYAVCKKCPVSTEEEENSGHKRKTPGKFLRHKDTF
ncbi:MAG: hypothetical protein OEL66_03545, partial [Desulfobulbaceae bacterium]|nr:hypothetical protein [Desulfobulbaceae bacterium]